VKALLYRSKAKANKLLASFRYLGLPWSDLPQVTGKEWLSLCAPVPAGRPLLYALVLRPRGRPGTWELAREAARVLEERAGVELNWAWALRSSGAVWLLLCPWALDPAGKPRWYRPGPGDLEALRKELGDRWDAPDRERGGRRGARW